MGISKEQLREIIKENGIENVGDIYTLFKESFKDMLQEMLEAEMDVSIGYPKNDKSETTTENKRNGWIVNTLLDIFSKEFSFIFCRCQIV